MIFKYSTNLSTSGGVVSRRAFLDITIARYMEELVGTVWDRVKRYIVWMNSGCEEGCVTF